MAYAALRSLGEHPQRTILVALGPAAATLLLLGVGMLIQGVHRKVEHILDDWGGPRVGIIAAYGTRGIARDADARVPEHNSLTLDDYAAIKTLLADRAITYALLAGSNIPVRAGARHATMGVAAVDLPFYSAMNWVVTAGAPMDDDDETTMARRCLLGTRAAAAIFGSEVAVGKRVLLYDIPFTVKGVLTPRGPDSAGTDYYDRRVYIPFSTGRRRVFNIEGIRLVGFRAIDAGDIEALSGDVADLLRSRHRISASQRDDFDIQTPRSLAVRYENAFRTISLAGVILVLTALGVAGAVVMNIMLLSVTQRQREIGLKRVLGSTRPDIFTEFLVEAVIVCVGGALLAVGVTAAGLSVLPKLAVHVPGTPAASYLLELRPVVALLALTASVLQGALAGTRPALRAARLQPAEALRSTL